MSRLAFHSDGKKMGSGNTYFIEIMPNQNDNIRPKSKKKTKTTTRETETDKGNGNNNPQTFS